MPPEFTAILGGTTFFVVVTIACSICFSLLITVGVIFVILRVMKSFGPDKDTLASGTPGQATILKVWQTGAMVNYNPQLGLLLEVRPPTGEPYQVEVKMVVPMVNIPQFQPGAVVPVKINPKDRQKVVLDVYGR